MNNKTTSSNKILTVIGIVLCVILIPILIINCTLIVKSIVNKDEVPAFAGVMPMIVLSPSMEPDIKEGDLIICSKVRAEDVKPGDVISFFDPSGRGTMVVTHKVDKVIEENGKLYFKTYGINNKNSDGTYDMDSKPVPAENLVGVYTGVRLPEIGNIALFMQTTAGLIVCVVIPIILLVGYDLVRRKMYDKDRSEDIEALKAELEALRKAQSAAAGDEKQQDGENKPE